MGSGPRFRRASCSGFMVGTFVHLRVALITENEQNIIVVGGGSHPSALPEETIKESMLDAVFIGEADYTFVDICEGIKLSDIP